MTVEELIRELEKMPPGAQAHIEVFIGGLTVSPTVIIQGVSQSEPDVIVISQS